MFRKLIDYLASVRTEMAKVTWPTRPEMLESSKIILVVSFVLAAAVFLVDRVLSLALEAIL